MTVTLDLGHSRYDIVIEARCFDRAGELLKLDRRVLIVTDDGVPEDYARRLAAQCASPFVVTLPRGEENKSMAALQTLLTAMLDAGFTRADCVCAVGGGNYHYETVVYLSELYAGSGLQNPGVIIDCNHANSGKNPFEQPRIVKEILSFREANQDVRRLVKGFMVESYIEDGCQSVGGGCYGKSITDACLGWDKTERLIYDIAEGL